MLGQSAFARGSSATADNRIFVYEVTGLQQNDITVQSDSQIRTSASTLVQVPYNRMNEKMQQILRMGGKIVSVYPLGETAGK
ncbi:phycobilisome linker polypeptide [Chamaesiphon sp. VAR_48_metabat_135_sub]|uniref:phycobilisome linker polypeptide n=1 Tax=Chamaesiphon sp. VAR_48_metabat_135_sub TaxID=2964699 RepID=UPI00286D4714|nr:phycobilisome linker polypeptide [Chamaesiphon sp. VAR_48_metabat_135_sub]